MKMEIDAEWSLFNIRRNLEWEKCSFYITRDKQQEFAKCVVKQGEYPIYNFLIHLFHVKGTLDINKDVFNTDSKAGNLINEFMKNLDLENVLDYLKKNSFEFYPVMEIYYNSLMSRLDVNNESYFRNFKELLMKNLHLFSRAAKHSLFLDMQNCCTTRIKHGNLNVNMESRKEVFEINKYILKEGLEKFDEFEERHYIQLAFFRNVVVSAGVVGEIDWLENFLNKYIIELAPEHRKNLYNYGMAYVCFERGKFEKSLELITRVEYEYFYFRVEVKTVQLRIFYELNLFEQANSLVDTFKHFLSKNKSLSPLYRKRNSIFLNYYIQLFKYKRGDHSISLKRIESEMSTITFECKSWTLRKLSELEENVTKNETRLRGQAANC